MFVEYYAYYEGDTYKATISSKTGTNLLYVGLVQRKCMKNGRSLGIIVKPC